MKNYKHIFFDLDHTLWDYEKNAQETLYEIHKIFELKSHNISVQNFHETYKRVNFQLWRAYNKAEITKDELRDVRFYNTLGFLGVKDKVLALKIEDEFLAICPRKPHVLPHTFETLNYLSEKYEMHIITNGFKGSTEEKLVNSRLRPYFKETITSECIGITKPNAKIFEYAVNMAGTNVADSIMIGDNPETDMQGALNFGIDRIYFNTHGKQCKIEVHHEIRGLKELSTIL